MTVQRDAYGRSFETVQRTEVTEHATFACAANCPVRSVFHVVLTRIPESSLVEDKLAPWKPSWKPVCPAGCSHEHMLEIKTGAPIITEHFGGAADARRPGDQLRRLARRPRGRPGRRVPAHAGRAVR